MKNGYTAWDQEIAPGRASLRSDCEIGGRSSTSDRSALGAEERTHAKKRNRPPAACSKRKSESAPMQRHTTVLVFRV